MLEKYIHTIFISIFCMNLSDFDVFHSNFVFVLCNIILRCVYVKITIVRYVS